MLWATEVLTINVVDTIKAANLKNWHYTFLSPLLALMGGQPKNWDCCGFLKDVTSTLSIDSPREQNAHHL